MGGGRRSFTSCRDSGPLNAVVRRTQRSRPVAMFDGTTVNLGIAFLAGLLSFLATCLVPIMPSYLAFLAGLGGTDDVGQAPKAKLLRGAIGFVVGFIGVFILLGLTVNTFVRSLGPYRPLIRWAGGAWLILLGFFLAGFIKLPWAERTFQFDARRIGRRGTFLSAVVTGTAFGFSWTPCVGPVLAVVLWMASQAGSAWQGGGLLLAYGIGLAIPFLLASLALQPMMSWLRRRMRWWAWLPRIAGVIVVISGVLMLSGRLEAISQYFARWMSSWSAL